MKKENSGGGSECEHLLSRRQQLWGEVKGYKQQVPPVPLNEKITLTSQQRHDAVIGGISSHAAYVEKSKIRTSIMS